MKKSKTWNQHIGKRENKFLVLSTIINHTPISRADIAVMTGLNKGTVSSLVSELIKDNILFEAGLGESSGGRRPVMLYFNNIAGYAIGIDLGVNFILGVLTDLDGNIIDEKNISFLNLNFDEIVGKIDQLINYFKSNQPISSYGIIGIGIGIPGIVSTDGDIHAAPNLEWKNKKIKTIFEEKYNIPVVIENEANAGAYGEQKFGVAKNRSNIVYTSIGMGIGVGTILNGNLIKGNNGFLGELGHMTIKFNGKRCTCGSYGCWELYASEKFLRTNMNKYPIKMPPDEFDILQYMISEAEKNNQYAIKLFEQIGDYIGIGINNIVNIFDPDIIIIGNRITSAQKWLEKTLITRFNQSEWIEDRDLEIMFSNLESRSTALGMAAFTIEHFLNLNFLQNNID